MILESFCYLRDLAIRKKISEKTAKRRMVSISLLRLFLLSLTQAGGAPPHVLISSTDHLDMFALLGDDVTLPCSVPSIQSCSSVNWNMVEEFQSITEVVKAGEVTAPGGKALRLGLLKDCSLEITHLELTDARLYSCDTGTLNSSVSLQILEELHCFLNIYRGHAPCNKKGIHIEWRTRDNKPLNGDRFKVENPSECFSKLIITQKPTDHHRQWKCQLTQGDTVKATIRYTTTIKALQTPAWVLLPLVLLICVTGLYMCNKRKHHKDAGSKCGPKPATVETTAGERFEING
uniref:Ig-like domain-containing protein n=1 Tax=Gasterosteus aculeatus aculeatus TaxID=481459 RepID=A0AAQ4PHN2_GASAC